MKNLSFYQALVLFIGVILSYSSVAHFSKYNIKDHNLKVLQKEPSEIKQEAYVILKNKCNVCHLKKNPFKVFSLKNMDRLAPRIKEQVFVLKRMPKGNKVKLTLEEKQGLLNWINAIK